MRWIKDEVSDVWYVCGEGDACTDKSLGIRTSSISRAIRKPYLHSGTDQGFFYASIIEVDCYLLASCKNLTASYGAPKTYTVVLDRCLRKGERNVSPHYMSTKFIFLSSPCLQLSLAYLHAEMWFSRFGCVALCVRIAVSMKLETHTRKLSGNIYLLLQLAPR